jgi:hypothetical protein
MSQWMQMMSMIGVLIVTSWSLHDLQLVDGKVFPVTVLLGRSDLDAAGLINYRFSLNIVSY